uniref:Threonine aldolase n=1 Tax=Triatoma infestans TaxID=30076 RepID=A0A170USX8_TRIIF
MIWAAKSSQLILEATRNNILLIIWIHL